MIRGAKYWNDRTFYFTQENNPDEVLEHMRDEEEVAHVTALLEGARVPRGILERVRKIMSDYLESCGPTAAVNCLAALGYDLDIRCPGFFRPQPEAVLMDWFHDIRNFDAMRGARNNLEPGKIPGNRVPQYYPEAVFHVFSANAEFQFVRDWNQVKHFLFSGGAVQLTLKNPGHYIACVAYDDSEDELIYHDSWPSRFGDGNGFCRRLEYEEYMDNVQPWAIFYDKPEGR